MQTFIININRKNEKNFAFLGKLTAKMYKNIKNKMELNIFSKNLFRYLHLDKTGRKKLLKQVIVVTCVITSKLEGA